MSKCHIVGNLMSRLTYILLSIYDRISYEMIKLCCFRLENSQFPNALHRGSYMSANVLFNLLNELGEKDKMQGLPSILSVLFHNEFNKLNNTRARMLDSIYHMTLKLLCHMRDV